MRPVVLTGPGTTQTIAVSGPTLHIVNDPWLDYTTSLPLLPQLNAATILVGFDTTPTDSNHDAAIPPFSEALIALPIGHDGKPVPQMVVFSYPATAAAALTVVPGHPNPLALLIEWLPIVVPTTIRPIAQANPLVNPVSQFPIFFPSLDARGNLWPSTVPNEVYDQTLKTNLAPHVRPNLAPSLPVTDHFALVANTLHTIAGLVPANPTVPASFGSIPNYIPWTVLRRAWISAATATLVVLGDGTLTVGSPGVGEVWRGLVPAGQAVALDFGEGLELAWEGNIVAWQVYSVAGGVYDATFLVG